jgi:hypothetical protein
MKKLTFIFILLFTFISCSKDDEVLSSADYLGKWTLVKMSSMKANFETTGSDMEWQEFYVFDNDGTFTKSRQRDATKTTASGTYTVNNISDGDYLQLNYPQDSDIIGSCSGNQKEELYLNSNSLLTTSWKNCDGPALEYDITK